MADWRLSLIHRRRLLRLFLFGLSTAAAVSGIAAGLKPAIATSVKSGREKRTTMSAYDFDFAGIEGGALPLKAWKGKPILVVNTASFCGFTPQYTDLEKLWGKYKDRGLVVLGVPSNDFGQQEPGSAKEIKAFCETYDVVLPADREGEGGRRRRAPVLPLDRGRAGRRRRATLELPQIPDRRRMATSPARGRAA